MMKAVDFCGVRVTRVVVGDNPFNGHSYVEGVHSGAEMMDFYTAERCVEALFEAESNGINTYMALADPFTIRVIRQYRNQGGKMHIVFQSYPAIPLDINIRQMMACDPIGIYHQGGSFDLLVEDGEVDEIHGRLEMIKKSGAKAGFGTHVPEVLLRAESENWGMDFYAACLYNARRLQRGKQSGFITGKSKDDIVFFPEDPPFMYESVKKVSKPCIVFKIFAGGQVFLSKEENEISGVVSDIFEDVFSNIKSTDVACIGVFQKYKNQIRENCDIAKRVLDFKVKS